tara:strand:- start:2685 stop:3563 length:879 start_codon:yes stop_codon:yes gene_type:complete
MKILVTGASGMLGQVISEKLNEKHQVFGIGTNQINSKSFNYRVFDLKSDNYHDIIKWSNPKLIIHCAAITNGNYCEENFEEAFHVNSFSTKKLLDATDEKVKFIYISTDAVFGGLDSMNNEYDLVNPKNIYAKSKELSEFFLLNSKRNFLIIRTTIVGLSNYNLSFVDWIINSCKRNKKITLFDDVKFNPITIWDLGDEIEFLIDKNKYEENILHISGDEHTTKFQFGIKLIKALELKTNNISKGSILKFKKRAKRANDQTLSVELYKKLYNRLLPDLETTIITIKKNYEKN